MEKIIGILAAIAAVLAGFGMVLFGKPKGDRQSASETTEQVVAVEPAPAPEAPTFSQPTPVPAAPEDLLEGGTGTSPDDAPDNAPDNADIESPDSTEDSRFQPISETPAQVEEPIQYEELPRSEDAATSTPAIGDPWTEESESSITLDFVGNTDQDGDSEDGDEAIELDLDDATQAIEAVDTGLDSILDSELYSATGVETAPTPIDETEILMARVAAARYQNPAQISAPQISTPQASKLQTSPQALGTTSASGLPLTEEVPFAVLQDSKRPPSRELQDLSQQILDWGHSKQLSQVPKLLPYANHSDSNLRRYVALALGQIAAPHTVKADIEKVIPVLGKLSQDSNAEVRSMAMKALSGIQSPQVLPYLEKGLLSSSGAIKEAANSAIQKLKLQYGTQPGQAEFPPSLQKKP